MKLLHFNRVGYFPKDCSSMIEEGEEERLFEMQGYLGHFLFY